MYTTVAANREDIPHVQISTGSRCRGEKDVVQYMQWISSAQVASVDYEVGD